MQWLIDIIWEKLAGVIVVWSGTLETIPDGWHLCDGTEGTPDLRGRFIVAAGDEYTPGDVGGSKNHQHTFTSDYHGHTVRPGAALAPGTIFAGMTTLVQVSGVTNTKDHLPPYYALAFIMKL